jgi:hypothetical protein
MPMHSGPRSDGFDDIRSGQSMRLGLKKWLFLPPVEGPQALLVAFGVIAIPTAIRAAVDGVIIGCEFTPYLPFVLLGAILAPWWSAGLAAIATVAILGGLYIQPQHNLACFLSGAAMFIGASAMIIGTVVLTRRALTAARRGENEASGGIVFSLEKGEVWASWYGDGPPMLLGSQRKVSAMMRDFLAQSEIAKRLNDKSGQGGKPL